MPPPSGICLRIREWANFLLPIGFTDPRPAIQKLQRDRRELPPPLILQAAFRSMASYASTPLPEGLTLRDPKTGDFVHYSYVDLVAEFARPLDYSLLEEDIKPTTIGKKIVELRDPRTGDMRAYSFIELHYELQCRYQIEMKQQGRWKSDSEVTEEAENSYYSPEASALMDADMENYSILTDPEAECVGRVANFWTAISMVPYMRAQRAAEERVAREGGHFKDYIAIERERQGI